MWKFHIISSFLMLSDHKNFFHIQFINNFLSTFMIEFSLKSVNSSILFPFFKLCTFALKDKIIWRKLVSSLICFNTSVLPHWALRVHWWAFLFYYWKLCVHWWANKKIEFELGWSSIDTYCMRNVYTKWLFGPRK